MYIWRYTRIFDDNYRMYCTHRVCCTRPIWLDSDVPEAGDPRLIFVASFCDLFFCDLFFFFFFGGSTRQLKNYQVVSTRMVLVAFQTVFVLGFSMQQKSRLSMTIFDNSIDGASTKAIAWPDFFLSGVRKGAAEVEVSRNGTSKQRRKGRGLRDLRDLGLGKSSRRFDFTYADL